MFHVLLLVVSINSMHTHSLAFYLNIHLHTNQTSVEIMTNINYDRNTANGKCFLSSMTHLLSTGQSMCDYMIV